MPADSLPFLWIAERPLKQPYLARYFLLGDVCRQRREILLSANVVDALQLLGPRTLQSARLSFCPDAHNATCAAASAAGCTRGKRPTQRVASGSCLLRERGASRRITSALTCLLCLLVSSCSTEAGRVIAHPCHWPLHHIPEAQRRWTRGHLEYILP